MNGSEVPILLKNSIIWVRDFPGENQTILNLTYKQAREFNSAAVRADHENHDPLRVSGSIERLKRKWFCPAEKFGVFQQYLPFGEVHIG
jgi:hypothetical protein